MTQHRRRLPDRRSGITNSGAGTGVLVHAEPANRRWWGRPAYFDLERVEVLAVDQENGTAKHAKDANSSLWDRANLLAKRLMGRALTVRHAGEAESFGKSLIRLRLTRFAGLGLLVPGNTVWRFDTMESWPGTIRPPCQTRRPGPGGTAGFCVFCVICVFCGSIFLAARRPSSPRLGKT